MKLLRFGPKGHEKPGIMDLSGNIRDLSAYVHDIDATTIADNKLLQVINNLDLTTLPIILNQRLGAPVANPGKLVFVGFNSRDHALELGIKVDEKLEPTLFLKPNSSLSGPNDPIPYSKKMRKLDWEAELAIVVGKQGKYIASENAHEYIFGYTCCNDLSDRFLQFDIKDSQFTKGKCFDGSAPIGPYIVTAAEINDANNLDIKLFVNGQLRQNFNTRNYILSDAAVISFVSNFFTLYPGDIISMGSAPGCAKSWGEQYLQLNDVVELEISKVGAQKQQVMLEESFLPN